MATIQACALSTALDRGRCSDSHWPGLDTGTGPVGRVCWITVPPEEGMSIQKELHVSSAQNSSGSGASKSSLIQTAPVCKPGTRVEVRAENGTRRATGVFPSVRMISMPAVASCPPRRRKPIPVPPAVHCAASESATAVLRALARQSIPRADSRRQSVPYRCAPHGETYKPILNLVSLDLELFHSLRCLWSHAIRPAGRRGSA